MGILNHQSSSGNQPGCSRGIFGINWSKWFPPVTSRSLLSHYLPASGALSHTLYTVHLFSPSIISRIFPTADLAVSNTILFNANVGLGFYVYFRRHLHRVNPWERVEFSVLTSTIFNFGTLLAAVLIKALFPAKSQTWLKSVTATALSAYLLSRAYRYMDLLDSRSNGRSSVSPTRSPTSSRPKRRASGSASIRTVASTSADHFSEIHSSPSRPPQHYYPMTPSATVTEADQTISELDDLDNYSSGTPNYRYLHTYALGNVNQTRPLKADIIRRSTMNSSMPKYPVQKRKKSTSHVVIGNGNVPCFVTPEPSLKELEFSPYTPPPSRLEKTSIKMQGMKKQKRNDRDEIDKFIDLVQWHAPLALIPFSFGCFVSGSVPMITTLKVILGRG